MTTALLATRFRNQRLSGGRTASAADVVSRLGAMQAQDYAGAKWAVGLHTQGLTDTGFDRAFDRGDVLRTHVLRPTWHFVSPKDLRWIVGLTAPRVHAFNRFYYRANTLEARHFLAAERAFTRALEGGRSLTRQELMTALARAGIRAQGQRLALLIMHAELELLLCSGPLRGKQFTYALVDERASDAPRLDRDSALATLLARYLASHGPATVRDFVWWSGLTVRDARQGLEAIGASVESREFDGLIYWALGGGFSSSGSLKGARLLPNYDEYLIAYRDRQLTVSASRARALATGASDLFPHHVLVDGALAGSWRRDVSSRSASITVDFYERPTARIQADLREQTKRYETFLGKPVTLAIR